MDNEIQHRQILVNFYDKSSFNFSYIKECTIDPSNNFDFLLGFLDSTPLVLNYSYVVKLWHWTDLC